MLAQTFEWFTRRSGVRRKAGDIYGAVVAAARQPGFYGAQRVADTPEGRFELVALHLFLAAERAKALGPGGVVSGPALAQALIEALITDMDDCMREMGVGDLTVPKRVKRAAAVFYERAGQYRAALATPLAPGRDDPLASLIAAAILPAATTGAFASELAAYVRTSQQTLGEQASSTFAAGQLHFAPPPSPDERPV